jgi:hypothetical protein
MNEKRRPFYPASKSPQLPKVSQHCPQKKVVKKQIIPKLNFHDRSMNLNCHSPIQNHYKIERYTSMETRVVETLKDFNIMHPCDVYILPLLVSTQLDKRGIIYKNASESAIEEALKTKILIKSKAEKIAKFRIKLLQRLASGEHCQVSQKEKCNTVQNPTRIPNVIQQ